jgi:hypothetical protein
VNSIAYELGAVFLLAAMLIFGSAHGFIPRSLRNAGVPVIVGVALLGFLIWRFGPEMWSTARSNAAPWLATSPASPAEEVPSPPPLPAKPPVPSLKGVAIRDVRPPEIPRLPEIPAVPEVPRRIVVAPAEKPAEDADEKAVPEVSSSAPKDHGVKKAVKSVGRFLHIGGKKEQPAQ